MFFDDYWRIQLRIATDLARKAHKGQLYGDKDYFEAHVLLVYRRVVSDGKASPMHAVAAMLHDVLEDTEYTVAKLAAEGVDPGVISVVHDLTKPEGADYMEYVSNLLCKAPIAVRVKWHDMCQNYSVGFREKYVKPIELYVFSGML